MIYVNVYIHCVLSINIKRLKTLKHCCSHSV